MKRYPDEIRAFIAENVQGTTTKDLAELVNAQFGTEFTKSSMKSYKTNYKLKSGTLCGLRAGMPTERYPAEVKEFIKSHYVGVGHQGMANMLNEAFGTNYTKGQMKAYYARCRLNSGRTGRFPKGHMPVRHIKKGEHLSPATEFEKGILPHNYRAVGSEVLRSDGYVYKKIAEPNKWRQKHVLIWEEANGPRPEKHVILFGDGNRMNFDLDNLILVSQAQMAVLNYKKLIQKSAELTRTGIVVADLLMKMTECSRKGRIPMDVKTKNFYTCRCCGKTSTIQEKIADCEKSHIGVDTEMTIEAVYKKGSRYPSDLHITMEDGAIGVYVFYRAVPAPVKVDTAAGE